MMKMRCLLPLALVVASAASTPVWAQPDDTTAAPEPDDSGANNPNQSARMEDDAYQGPRPWAETTSPAEQEKARLLFDEGNALLLDGVFAKAAGKYREALEHWQHPAIHYNLARALINLDQPIAVYQSLERSIAYGPAPLGQDKYEQAERDLKIFAQQIARIEIVCNEPGAEVALDGRVVFRGPGSHKALVRIGEHTVSAIKPGYIPVSESRLLKPEEQARVELKLYTPEDRTFYERRWSAWKPWAVLLGGAALVGVGTQFQSMSQDNFNQFDNAVFMECPAGCTEDALMDSTRELQATGRLQRNAAIGAFVTGGVLAATGLVMLYMNQPRKVLRIEDSNQEVALVPVLAPDGAGVSAWIRF